FHVVQRAFQRVGNESEVNPDGRNQPEHKFGCRLVSESLRHRTPVHFSVNKERNRIARTHICDSTHTLRNRRLGSVMASEVKFKPGWLVEDVNKAAARVLEWKRDSNSGQFHAQKNKDAQQSERRKA